MSHCHNPTVDLGDEVLEGAQARGPSDDMPAASTGGRTVSLKGIVAGPEVRKLPATWFRRSPFRTSIAFAASMTLVESATLCGKLAPFSGFGPFRQAIGPD